MTNMDFSGNQNSTEDLRVDSQEMTSTLNPEVASAEQTSPKETVVEADQQVGMTFAELGLPEHIIKAVHDIGFTSPTPIQVQAIPHLIAGKDILGLAQTGSGKTASFMLPLLANLEPHAKGAKILVLSPTRELAIQVDNATKDFLKYMPKIDSLAVYGGQPYGGQIKALKSGVQIIIATPGRLVDHINKNTINLENLQAIVLDEADEMLSMGFADDLETILKQVPTTAQTALFSATMPKTIESLTKKYLKDPEIVRIKSSKTNEPRIEQFYWLVQGYDKDNALVRFLEIEDFDAAIVFCKTRQGCNELTEVLLKNNIPAACLHGDMSQEVRESTLNGLRNESINVLIATDVAARGLDIDRLDLVINYDLPQDNESYVHRIGRTGRAGREGRSISFVGERERLQLFNIEKTIKKELNEIKVPNNKQLEEIRRNKFRKMLEAKLDDHNLERYTSLVEELIPQDYEAEQVIAALVNMATHDYKLVLPKEPNKRLNLTYDREHYENRRGDRGGRFGGSNGDWETYYFGVGRDHKIEVKEILQFVNRNFQKVKVGAIKLNKTFTIVELPRSISRLITPQISKAKIRDIPVNLRVFENHNNSNGRWSNDRRQNDNGRRNFGDRRDGDRFNRNNRNDRNNNGNGRFNHQDRNDGFNRGRGEGRFDRNNFSANGRGERRDFKGKKSK